MGRLLILTLAAAAIALPAWAQPAPPLLKAPFPLARGLEAQMTRVVLRPLVGNPTTVGRPGHKHPGATYVYVLRGAVVSRLGAAPEQRYEAGQAWSEQPGEAHYIVNASPTDTAELLVLFVAAADAGPLTAPLSPP